MQSEEVCARTVRAVLRPNVETREHQEGGHEVFGNGWLAPSIMRLPLVLRSEKYIFTKIKNRARDKSSGQKTSEH